MQAQTLIFNHSSLGLISVSVLFEWPKNLEVLKLMQSLLTLIRCLCGLGHIDSELAVEGVDSHHASVD